MTNTVVNTLNGGTFVTGLAVNPSGTLLYVTSDTSPTSSVNVINLVQGQSTSNSIIGNIILPGFSQANRIAISPSSNFAYVTSLTNSMIEVLQLIPYITINPALITPTIAASNTPTVQTGKYNIFSVRTVW